MGIIGVENRNGALKNDDSVIEVLIDKMDGAPGQFHAVVKSLLLRVEAGESRQQRRVDVEDAIGEGGDELGGEEAHVAGEADQFDAVTLQAGQHVGIVLGALAALGDEDFSGQAEFEGGAKAGGVGDVGDYDGDLDSGKATFADGLCDGQEVGAPAGEENSQANPSLPRTCRTNRTRLRDCETHVYCTLRSPLVTRPTT